MPVSYTVESAKTIAGSMTSVGYASAQAERGIIECIVKSSGGTATDLGVAAACTSGGHIPSTHPEITGLPLQNIVVSNIGTAKFKATGYYSWSGQGHWGGSSATAVADFDIGFEPRECFSIGPAESDGIPSATVSGSTKWFRMFNENDGTIPPAHYLYPVPAVKVRIPIRTTDNPVTATILAAQTKVNSATATIFSGRSTPLAFAAGTLRFDGLRTVAYANASYPFVGHFEFTYCPGFTKQLCQFEGTPKKWTIAKTAPPATANFATVFSAYGIT